MSFVRSCSIPKFACWTLGFLNFGSKRRIVGKAAAPPVGGVAKTFGYVGTVAPVNVSVWTLMPLFECAVPIMIAGVRP